MASTFGANPRPLISLSAACSYSVCSSGFFFRLKRNRMLWCIWEAYDVHEGARGGKFPSWRTPELYIEEARRRFDACKELGVIPDEVEWDPPLMLETSVSK